MEGEVQNSGYVPNDLAEEQATRMELGLERLFRKILEWEEEGEDRRT